MGLIKQRFIKHGLYQTGVYQAWVVLNRGLSSVGLIKHGFIKHGFNQTGVYQAWVVSNRGLLSMGLIKQVHGVKNLKYKEHIFYFIELRTQDVT